MKGKNPIVKILVALLVLAALAMYFFTSGDEEIKTAGQDLDKTTKEVKQVGTADSDDVPTEVKKLMADMQSLKPLAEQVDNLQKTVEVLRSENKTKDATIEALKKGVETGTEPFIEGLKAPENAPQESTSLLAGLDPAGSTQDKPEDPEQEAKWLNKLPPLPFTPQSKKSDGQQAYVDPNQIVWVKPMDGSYIADDKAFGSTVSNYMPNIGSGGNDAPSSPGLLDEVGSKAKTELGLESGKDPKFTIPHGSILSDSMAVTALVGRIPVQGQVQDPWNFKISTGRTIMMPNGHELQGLEKTIVEGTAIGDLNMRCVSGKIDVMTFIFTDGRIVTHKAGENDSKAKSLGYITDRHANPCIPGELITNAPQAITQMGILGAIEGFAQGYADAETETRQYSDGTTGQVVVGDHLKNAGFGGLADGTSQVKQYFADRMGQYFDVIYAPAGQMVDIHITDEIKIDYDPMGRKVRYEGISNATHGFMD